MLYNLTRKYGDYMNNKKGFALTETLVVTVFLVTIFTFIYVSIVPLMGRYDDLIDREKDIDIVYKLYNIREILLHDDNRTVITSSGWDGNLVCNKFAKAEYCAKLFEQLELTNYRLIYVNNIHSHIDDIKAVDEELDRNTSKKEEIYKYIRQYEDDEGEYLILLDLSPDKYTKEPKHTIAHLLYEPFIQTY